MRVLAPWLGSLLALAPLLSGCDSAKAPFERAAALEAQGKLAEASAAYGEVCVAAAASPRCPVARRRAAQLRLKLAINALHDRRYAEASALAASAAAEPAVAPAASAVVASPDLSASLAFGQLSQAADRVAAITSARVLGDQPTTAASGARAMVRAEGPKLLLAAARDACKPDGKGSCAAAAAALADGFPDAPERREADALAQAELERLYPALDRLEKLLIQRLEIYDREAKLKLCAEEAGNGDCDELNEKLGPSHVSEPFLRGVWEKALKDIPDPTLVARLEQRWNRLGSTGELDAEPWPKPKKK